MPARSVVIIFFCALTVAVGANAISWSMGPHRQLEDAIDQVLSSDTPTGGIDRNYSPYCLISCPTVEKTTEFDRNISDAEQWIRDALVRSGYEPGNRERLYLSDGIEVSYDVEPAANGSIIKWRAAGVR